MKTAHFSGFSHFKQDGGIDLHCFVTIQAFCATKNSEKNQIMMSCLHRLVM